MANDQAMALRKLGVKNAYIMGVSQGGMIAQHLAIDHKELVEKLVIVVSGAKVNEMIQSNVNHWIELAQQGKYKELMIDTAEKSYSPKYLRKFRRVYPLIGLFGKPADFRRFLINARVIPQFNAIQELKSILCPTLIIGGEMDKVVGVQASYELHENIGNSLLYVYSGLGHATYEEVRDFNQRVFDFLENTP